MGGKKQAQRTKGNTRPSSSGRTAELLARESGGAVGFVGFGTMAGDLGYVPMKVSDEIDVSVDGDFRMVMRKMTKKDVTTKLKAIQEFTGMCKEKDEDAVNAVLPYWPRLYLKITMDHDRRVREAIQQAHEQVALKVRRNLAPHLKSIMGPWLVAQCDTYAPASSAAKTAYNSAFSPAKQSEAVTFCREEILAHIEDNIFKQTPTSLSDSKSTPPEEVEAKYNRVVTSSLLALRHFLLVLPKSDHESLQPQYTTFLSEAKFWKYAKNKAPSIRGAFYSVLSAICQAIPNIAENFASKLCPAVLTNIDDTDPSVCQPLWEAVLHVVSTIDECWKHVNTRKAFLPKLWSLFRNSGSGSAIVIYPNLLPMLSRIPSDVIGEGVGFYNEFFGNMKIGLSSERVQTSSSECVAVVNAFIECLRFSLQQNLQNIAEGHAIQDHLILDQLLPVLEASIIEEKPILSSSPLFSQVSSLLKHVEKISQSENPNRETCLRILDQFWKNFSPVCVNVVETTDRDQALENVAFFLECVKIPETSRKSAVKKRSKVKFSEGPPVSSGARRKIQSVDEREEEEKSTMEPVETVSVTDGPLLKLVCNLAKISHQLIQQNKSHSSRQQRFLAKLVTDFASPLLFQALMEDTSMDGCGADGTKSEDGTNSQTPDAQGFFCGVLLPWMEQVEKKEMEDLSIEFLVDMMLAVIKSCTSDKEKMFILNQTLKKCDNTMVLYNLVRKVIASPNDAAMIQWLKGPEFGSKLVTVAQQLCENSLTSDSCDSANESSWMLISLGLSTNNKLEPVISPEYMEQILNRFHQSLPKSHEEMSGNEQQLQRCISFICDVTCNFFNAVQGCFMIQAAEELLFTLFQLNCTDSYNLSDPVIKKLKETWHAGTQSLITQRGGFLNDTGFLSKAASWIKQSALQSSTPNSMKSLAESGIELCEIVRNSLPVDEDDDSGDSGNSAVQSLFKLMIPDTSDWQQHRHQLPGNWKSCVAMSRVMTFSSIPESSASCSAPIPRHVLLSIFLSTALRNCCHGNKTEDFVQDGDLDADVLHGIIAEIDMNKPGFGIDVGDFSSDVMEGVYGLTWCRAILGLCADENMDLKGMPSTLQEICKSYEMLNSNFSELLTMLKPGHWEMMLSYAVERSLEFGNLWSMSAGYLLSQSRKSGITLDQDIIQTAGSLDRFAILDEGSLHTLQCIIPHLNLEYVLQLAEINTARLITSTGDSMCTVTGGLGALAILNKCLACNAETSQLLSSVMDLLSSLREEQFYLFGCNVNGIEFSKVRLNIEVIQLITNCVIRKPSLIATTHWDFVMCSVVSWLQSCCDSLRSNPSTSTQVFCRSVFDCLDVISDYITSDSSVLTITQRTEWREFFSESAFTTMFPTFIEIAGNLSKTDQLNIEGLLLQSLCEALVKISADQMKSSQIAVKLRADSPSHMPDNIQALLNHLCPMVMAQNKVVQLTAYTLLLKLMPELPEYDENETKQDEVKEENTLPPPAALMDVYNLTSAYVDGILSGIRVGESVIVKGYSDAYHYTLAYLLSWKLLLAFFKGASAELRAGYAAYFRKHKMVHSLLDNLFRLMPELPVTSDKSSSKNMFIMSQINLKNKDQSPSEIRHLCCSVYYSTLEDVPAMVRQWWNGQDKRVASYVDNFTTKYVSPLLCSQEIQAVQNTEHTMENMSVKGRPVTREVIATYTMELSEEVSVELVIQLPQNHPLGIVTVDSGKKIGVKTAQWRNWMLQLTTFLVHQNGSILDGLLLWKRNVDKRFEGLEDCMICFSVIHGSNCSLPRLTCRTCKKKFHSECLYKWFSTSNQSTCPLCRNLF